MLRCAKCLSQAVATICGRYRLAGLQLMFQMLLCGRCRLADRRAADVQDVALWALQACRRAASVLNVALLLELLTAVFSCCDGTQRPS